MGYNELWFPRRSFIDSSFIQMLQLIIITKTIPTLPIPSNFFYTIFESKNKSSIPQMNRIELPSMF